jgi:2,5-diamino-6-(ribosylamino)-4(3H)-pyrimidinone 5'-phosphate reductase
MHVVVHVAVSLDGATTGFDPDVGRFYELARRWKEDVTLAGADTILAQACALADAPRPGPAEDGPLLAVVDGQSRIDEGLSHALRDVGHWSGVRVLRAAPGERHVALRAALEALGGVVRVDSGGALNGALLREGLVDELSLLVHPVLVGEAPRWHGGASAPALERLAVQRLDGGVTWLRYRVTRA